MYIADIISPRVSCNQDFSCTFWIIQIYFSDLGRITSLLQPDTRLSPLLRRQSGFSSAASHQCYEILLQHDWLLIFSRQNRFAETLSHLQLSYHKTDRLLAAGNKSKLKIDNKIKNVFSPISLPLFGIWRLNSEVVFPGCRCPRYQSTGWVTSHVLELCWLSIQTPPWNKMEERLTSRMVLSFTKQLSAQCSMFILKLHVLVGNLRL